MLSKKEYFLFIIIITMMSMMGLLASDVYIPALSQLSVELRATPSNIQLTLGVYLLGLSVFQLFCGPLSDHFGRRPVLLGGFVLYTVASLACVLAGSLEFLIIARFFQAIGACVGLVVGRAVIADLFNRDEASGVYNIVYPLVAASPAIAPFIGGYLTAWFGWRFTFLFVMLFGVVLLIMTAKFLRETRKPHSEDQPSRLTKIFSDIPGMIKNTGFLRYIVCICAIYGAWFTYLSEATFLFSKMGYSPHEIGYFYFPLAIAIYFGNFLCKRLVSRIGLKNVFYIGQGFFILGSIIFFLGAIFMKATNPLEIILPMAIVAVANGIILPLGIPSAVALFPRASGSASGFVGFCQIGFSALCASFIGDWFGISELALASVLLVLSVGSLVLYLIFSRMSLRTGVLD